MQKTFQQLKSKEAPIGVVGLGYVGLPLACLLAEKYKVVGFDIKGPRVDELRSGHDSTREVEEKSRLLNPNLTYTTNAQELSKCPLIIVAVPTPVDRFKNPDLTPVIAASRTVGSVMKAGCTVVFESTVYPGVTEETCGPILAEKSGLTHGVDFFLGYSPERVNPGDKEHTIDKIIKVVSGSTPEICELLAQVYGSVITAGVHRAANIKTAEAAKVIENTQRDLNIALINELSMIFHKVGIDTMDVIEAAGTKWNFLKFQPGLVGGHCIGVDPYYLTHLAEGLNLHPQVIQAGRRINDNMGTYIARQTLKLMLDQSPKMNGGQLRVGVLGITFKENVPDLRNTKVIDVVEALENFNCDVHVVDPVADPHEYAEEYNRKLETWDDLPQCDALIIAVKHRLFQKEFTLPRLREKLTDRPLIIDIKGIISREEAAAAGVKVWRL